VQFHSLGRGDADEHRPKQIGVRTFVRAHPNSREGAMEIGTKKWHESLSDVGWEVLALAGMLMQASVLAIIIGIVYLLQHRG
jgi:hypothetical protein